MSFVLTTADNVERNQVILKTLEQTGIVIRKPCFFFFNLPLHNFDIHCLGPKLLYRRGWWCSTGRCKLTVPAIIKNVKKGKYNLEKLINII